MHGKGHTAAGRKVRGIGQLQGLPIRRHSAEAVQQRTAASRQIQGENGRIGGVFSVRSIADMCTAFEADLRKSAGKTIMKWDM